MTCVEADEHLGIKMELERKYLDALGHVAARMDMGEISQEAGIEAFNAVFQTVSGLVEWEDLNEVMAEIKHLKPEAHISRYVLVKGAETICLEVNRSNFTVFRHADGKTACKRQQLLTQGDAFNEAERIRDGLIRKEWKELA